MVVLKNVWWAEPDLNRRPFDYQSNAPAKLSYQPPFEVTEVNTSVGL